MGVIGKAIAAFVAAYLTTLVIQIKAQGLDVPLTPDQIAAIGDWVAMFITSGIASVITAGATYAVPNKEQ